MSKMIDGNALIMSLTDWWYSTFREEETEESKAIKTVVDEVEKYVDGYPTYRGWIPCSERLPNYREVVLISTFWGVRMAERDAVKEDGADDFWYLFLDDATAHPRYVYAWMPLPEPYKGGDDK